THVRHYFGTKVSIWTDAGVLLASQNVTSAPGIWRETPLGSPVLLAAGQRYRIGVYTAGGGRYGRFDQSSTFADGTIDQAYYAIVVTNIGPSVATGVFVTNALASSATVVSVAVSQGGYTIVGRTVTCNVGTLAADTSATITLLASAGSLTAGNVALRSTIART